MTDFLVLRNAAIHWRRPDEDLQHYPEGHRRHRVPTQYYKKRHRVNKEAVPVFMTTFHMNLINCNLTFLLQR